MVKGDDMDSAIKNLKFKIQDSKCQIVYVSTPDYEGGLEGGYAKAVEAVIESIVAKTIRHFVIPACPNLFQRRIADKAAMTE